MAKQVEAVEAVEAVEVKAVDYSAMSDEDLKAAATAEAGAGAGAGKTGADGSYTFHGVAFSGRMGEVLKCCMEGLRTTQAIGKAIGITSRNADSQKGYLRDRGIAFIKQAGVSCKVREAESVRRTRSYIAKTGRYVSGHEAKTPGQGYWEYTLADGTLERSY
jgi:hypothetical protein